MYVVRNTCDPPPNQQRPPVILECKTFGVRAKNPRDSQRRKVQEALWLLIQLRRYCPETKEARIILVTGEMPFLNAEIALLQDKLAPDFHILSIKDTARLQVLID